MAGAVLGGLCSLPWTPPLLSSCAADESEERAAQLRAWLTTLRAAPARDAEALCRWRREFPDLSERLARLAQEPTPPGPGALMAWSALATDPSPFPPGALRERVSGRRALLSRLARGELSAEAAGALGALAGELLRELAGDPLGGSWRAPALLALAGRPAGLATLRRVAAAGGPHLAPALRALVSQKDGLGLSEALSAALQRGDVSEVEAILGALEAYEGAPSVDRVRGLLRAETPPRWRATLARALGGAGWKDTRGALRRLLREPSLSRADRVGVTVAYLRLGGEPGQLSDGVEILAEVCVVPDALGREALWGLTFLPGPQVSAALRRELLRPDAEGARRARAIHAGQALGLADLGPSLRELLRDGTQPALARLAAARALGSFSSPEDQGALVLTTRESSPALRRAALEALTSIPRPKRVSALGSVIAESLGDEEPALRRLALRAIDSPQDLPLLRAGLAKGRPSLVDPREATLWLERARSLSLKDEGPARWLLSRWESRPELSASRSLARATLRYAQSLPSPLAAPALLDLLEHSQAEVQRSAHEALAQRYPSGAEFAGDLARWRQAWLKNPALFR